MAVEAAVETVLDAMRNKGYIDIDKNSVLISVKNDDKKQADALSDKLLDSAYEAMGKKHGTPPSVLSQSISDNDSTKELAKK